MKNKMRNLKKSFLTAFFVIFVSLLQAQSLQGIKICIDPGHGGHDSNDRFISATGYWESEGNLTKAIKLKEYLESEGATVILTRSENNTSDDLPLSQRAAIANANNVDYFHSIHSNAFNAKSNYTLILFNGSDSAPTFSDSKVMGQIMTEEIYRVNRTTAFYNRGDRDFLGFNLGVLKTLSMPGTLSEGSFHDYIPESWRLKNEQYLHHESLAIMRSFMKYFNAGELATGAIGGILRDPLEEVPSSYNPTSGTKDNLKPINNIKVSIPELGLVSQGDYYNNGYYYFDNLHPGEYKVIFEAEDYAIDSAVINVTSDESVLYDLEMQQTTNPNNPTYLSIFPADSSVEVSNITNLVIDFDIRMDTEKTENAFSITPFVEGSFSWEQNFKRMIFTPKTSYVQGTEYKVNISTDASSYFSLPLAEEVNFSFTTREKFNLISNYPLHNDTDISSTVVIRFIFEKAINSSSLGGNISFTNANDETVAVTVNTKRYTEGIIEFEPKIPLEKNEVYKVSIKGGLSDQENVKLLEDILVEFRIENSSFTEGIIVNGFEDLSEWVNPVNSSKTTGITVDQTDFSSAGSKKVQGESAIMLEYGFSGDAGLIDIGLVNKQEIDVKTNTQFGVWIFGDNSKNTVNYNFTGSNDAEYSLMADTLNWTGWKFISIDFSEITNEEKLYFEGVSLSQSSAGEKKGIVYFDAAQTDFVTPIDEIENVVYDFALDQNYPNPFNPSTKIEYTVPSNKEGLGTNVSLKIFNSIGEEIETLVNGEKEPGNYSLVFNAKKLTSGIYYAHLRIGEMRKTIKMILLK